MHGPAQPAVYGSYKHFRWNPITEEVAEANLSPEQKEVVDEVLTVYGTDSAFELERRTHTEPPWIDARCGIPDDQESNAVIPAEAMTRYFSSLKK